MRRKKDKVFDFIFEYTMHHKYDDYPTFTTQFLSEKLDMQRTNISSILNQLVAEGKVLKKEGRPVLYQLKGDTQENKEGDFSKLIGYKQSLKEATMIAQAAILYPQKSTSILLIAESGSGVRYFSKEIHQFALTSRILKEDAPFIVFDCKNYIENLNTIGDVLFGNEKKQGLAYQANKGVLLVKNADLLPGYERTILFSIVRDIHNYTNNNLNIPSDFKCILICTMASKANDNIVEVYKDKIDFVIQMPLLSERPLEERFALIEQFLKHESKMLDRTICAQSSLLHALLLYETQNNIRGLKNDIHTGCANSYARFHGDKQQSIEILLSDFPNYVRKGMIYYKNYKEEINELVPGGCKYSFTRDKVLKSNTAIKAKNIYQSIDTKKRELKKHSIKEHEINTIISLDLQQDFTDYYKKLVTPITSFEQLQNFVSDKLINNVKSFIDNASIELGYAIKDTVFYGICIHLNTTLIRVNAKQRISNEEIKRIIDLYPKHYELSKGFVKKIEQEFGIQLNIDEIVYIILFLLTEKNEVPQNSVVTLIVMHGESAATSLANAINKMANSNTTFGYDLSLDINIEQAYSQLKEYIRRIHQGKGVLVIYDMGSIKTMMESISIEERVDVKFIEMPITLIGIAVSNKIDDSYSLPDIYTYVQENYNEMEYTRVNNNKKVIIVISDSREDLSKAITYIKQNFELQGIELISIPTEDRNTLYTEVNTICKKGEVIGIIGGYNPNLSQFPFLTIEKMYASEATNVLDLFNSEDEFTNIYGYFQDQFEDLNIYDLREHLELFMKQLEFALGETLNNDKKIGLIMHIACLIDRIRRNQETTVNNIITTILHRDKDLVRKVKLLLNPIEITFGIEIKNIEIATIISIVKKSK